MYIALKALDNSPVALPSAIYSTSMLITAALFGFWLSHRSA